MRTRGFTTALLLGIAALTMPLRAATPEPRVRDDRVGEVDVVEGAFEVDATADVAWAVLTDYPGLPRFVRSLKTSRVVRREGDRLTVEQTAEAGAFFFRRDFHLVLAIDEVPERTIAFRDESGRDFELYQGTWTVTPTANGCRVVYRLRATPRQRLPAFIGRGACEATARELLGEVRTEMVRRQHEQALAARGATETTR